MKNQSTIQELWLDYQKLQSEILKQQEEEEEEEEISQKEKPPIETINLKRPKLSEEI